MRSETGQGRTYRQAASNLVEQLRSRGIDNQLVLDAMARTPREEFVSDVFKHRAYEDEALPIECAQTISQPYTVAYQTQMIEPEPDMKVLEIGTGSGYQAAVLCNLGARVYSIERHADLLQEARRRLERLGCSVATKVGDGTLGWSEYAPYDGIIVTAGAPKVPASLLKQLAPGGRLLIPVGDRTSQVMQRITRIGDSDQYETHDLGDFKFVPLIGRRGWTG